MAHSLKDKFKYKKNQSSFKEQHLIKIKALSILYPYIKHYKHLFFLAFISLTVAAIIMLLLPIAVRHMIDQHFFNPDGISITSYFIILFFLAAILGLASSTRYHSVLTLGEKIATDLRCNIFNHIINLSPAFYDRSHSGDIISRLSSDITLIKYTIGSTVSITLRHILTIVGALSMMIITSPMLSALVLIVIPLVVLPLILLSRKVQIRTKLAQNALARANAIAHEKIIAIRTIQAFNAQSIASMQYSHLLNQYLKAAESSILSRSLLTGLTIFLISGSVITVVWIGSHNVLSGNMSQGTLGQFILYAILATGSFGQLSEIGGEFAQAAGATERLAELLEEKSSIQIPINAKKLPNPPKGSLRFDKVSFTYPSHSTNLPAINQLTFSVKSGETVAIVGPSGAGKSTIFSLLLRFYDPQKGNIYIDDINLQQADPIDIRARIAYVAQETTICSGTLRQNIAFGREIKNSELEKSAQAANAYNFIMSLKEGFDTSLGERGITLSGGQKQRIALARALLSKAPILLLDEATSALDAESERFVQIALNTIMKSCTTVIIAHRLATILKADRILVMDHGKIIEEGTHNTLIAQNGLYTRLAKLQFFS
ncbi:MAG: bacterial [Candidatus Tokpelaia sp. JSC161]|jgi:ATP-binding cassette subfamily B protein|nr:MAG: bacterial [Candidatus Tokpelaia sp. JSC161]